MDKLVYPGKSNSVADLSSNKMICALSAIALEMEKYHKISSCHNFGANEEIHEKLRICMSNLRLGKKRNNDLKQRLKKACYVAKAVMTAKENSTTLLHNDINNAKHECADFYHKNKLYTEAIHNIKSENFILLEKILNLEKFVELGYKELQKMRNEPANDVLPAIQLKEIILSCGQYYADYCNEMEARLLVEQKNRFLNNKINILSSTLQAFLEKINNSRYEIKKLRKENCLLKSKQMKGTENCGDFTEFDELYQDDYPSKFSHQSVTQRIDLRSHLEIVKNLLNGQDTIIKDLTLLSKEFEQL